MERIKGFLRDTSRVLNEGGRIRNSRGISRRSGAQKTQVAGEKEYRETRKREEAQDLKKLKDPDKPDMSVHSFIRNSIQLWLFSVMLACFLVLQPKGLNSH